MSILTNSPGTLLGPLTSSWSIPQSCTVNFQLCSTCSSVFQGQKCVTDLDDRGSPLQDNYKCWPPVALNVDTPQHPLVGWGFYSPGLACPTGYTSACTAVYGEQPGWDNQFSLRPGETAVGCCPNGFTCTNSNGNKCVAIATTPVEAPTAECSGTDMVRSVLATLTPDIVTKLDSGISKVATVERTMTMWAPLFQLNFQSTDLETTTTRTTSISTPIPTSAPIDDQFVSVGDGKGLPTVTKVAIGVGIGVGSLLLAGLVLWIILRKRNQGRRPKASPVLTGRDSDKMVYAGDRWSQSFSSGNSGRPELYGNFGAFGRSELGDTQRPVELPVDR